MLTSIIFLGHGSAINSTAGPDTVLYPLPIGNSDPALHAMNFTAQWLQIQENDTAFPAGPSWASGILHYCPSAEAMSIAAVRPEAAGNTTAGFVLGRASADSTSDLWHGLFPRNGTEQNASALLNPPVMYILQDAYGQDAWADPPDTSRPMNAFGDQTYAYTWNTFNVMTLRLTLKDHQWLLQLSGLTPCCVNSSVPSANLSSGASGNGSFQQALLLNVVLRPRPGADHKWLIIGLLLGVVGVVLLGSMLAWAFNKYGHRVSLYPRGRFKEEPALADPAVHPVMSHDSSSTLPRQYREPPMLSLRQSWSFLHNRRGDASPTEEAGEDDARASMVSNAWLQLHAQSQHVDNAGKMRIPLAGRVPANDNLEVNQRPQPSSN
ncbi:hypothetical protein WJX73_008812 [Symbiochloris irregularis]|uniref:Uncharacterized protein n=1 Tax=Symbiochloris irregularis TaxID=706552 RepID=A0AAW1NZB1_9CHLO